MMSESTNRSASVSTPTRRKLLAGVTMSLGGLALSSTGVYDALTDTKQFNNVTQLSAAIWPGQGEHLAAGWKANYWEPLEKFLA